MFFCSSLNFIDSNLQIVGEDVRIDKKASIIIFRILQEFFSNTIKHSKASNLDVTLTYSEDILHILAKDNGVGFSNDENLIRGIGLTNIEARAKLIGATAVLSSEKNKGTSIEIKYKL